MKCDFVRCSSTRRVTIFQYSYTSAGSILPFSSPIRNSAAVVRARGPSGSASRVFSTDSITLIDRFPAVDTTRRDGEVAIGSLDTFFTRNLLFVVHSLRDTKRKRETKRKRASYTSSSPRLYPTVGIDLNYARTTATARFVRNNYRFRPHIRVTMQFWKRYRYVTRSHASISRASPRYIKLITTRL